MKDTMLIKGSRVVFAGLLIRLVFSFFRIIQFFVLIRLVR